VSSAMRAQQQTQPGSGAFSKRIAGALDSRLAALLAVVTLALILWPLNGMERDYDEGVYWQSLRAMASGHSLFTSVFSSQPPFFLVSLYPFYTLFGQDIAAARFGIAVFSVIGVIAMYWLGRELGGSWVGLAAAALLAIDPLFLHEARTLQAEAPALALEILCIALAVAAMRRTGRARTLLALASGLALALGTLTKLLDIVAIVPITLYLAAPIFATFQSDGGRLRQPTADALRPALRESLAPLGWVVVGGAIGCIAVLLPFAGSFGALWDQVVRFHLAAARVEPAGILHNAKIIAGGMTTLGIPTLLALALALWRRAWRMVPPLLWLGASGLLLLRQAPLFNHHIVLVIPCLALIAALGLTHLPQPTVAQTQRWLTLGFSAVLVICFLVGAGLGVRSAASDAREPNAATLAAVGAIAAFTTPGQPVVADDQYLAALADRSTPPELVDTSSVRIAAKYLTAPQLEAILSRPDTRFVVLATGRLQQTPGFMPWLSANYRKLVDLGDGGAIYERAPSGSPVV
jgi:hypothetical protein